MGIVDALVWGGYITTGILLIIVFFGLCVRNKVMFYRWKKKKILELEQRCAEWDAHAEALAMKHKAINDAHL